MNETAREAANRANATKSTGPVTPEGKEKSSKNAVTTALTGRTVLLPSDNLPAYESHLQSYLRQFRPVTEYEFGLVQSLADTDWRLQRIPHLIFALEARGYIEFANAFPDKDPDAVALSIEIEARIKYEKQFRNLEIQESRLQRRRDKAVVELEAVIKERDARRKTDLETASKLYLASDHDGQNFEPAEHGFDFSTDDIRAYLNGKRAAHIAREAMMRPTLEVLASQRPSVSNLPSR